jgi:hypothetical protein
MTKRKSPKDKGAKDKGDTAGREWRGGDFDEVRARERAGDGAAGVTDAMCAAGAVA